MSPSPAPDQSLYELALATDPALPLLQVSPTTLKAAFSAVLELLIDRELPAVVWAKLPRGAVWQTELAQYSALAGVAKALYVFKNPREEGTDDTLVSAIADPAADPDSLLAGVAETPPAAWQELLLAPESQLRREYFLLVWAENFQGCILAHRPRSAQPAKAPVNAIEAGVGLAEAMAAGAIGDSQERRQHLLVLSSFDAGLIAQVIGGLAHAETMTVPTSSIASASGGEIQPKLALADAVAQWQKLTGEMAITPSNPATLGQLFMKQVQRQEEVWQRNAAYRRQADLVEILQIQKEELSNALRAKADFINTVGQELRTPLTTIKTALTLLNSPSLKPPQRQRYMELIEKECDRQSSLITSLLDLVQLDQAVSPTALESIRMADIVPGVVSTYQPLAEEKGVRLAYTVPEDLPSIACMANWLKQIVINLLHNGIKFTPTGGNVWVRAKKQGSYVNLEVRDTGIGMAPNDLPKIFDRFYRVRQASLEETSGAGLGLTIVQQLLVHCGGSISVKSKPGEGSTFTVLLPIHPKQPLPPSG
ncbi:histidine kinase [Phormidium sp. FACHB-592]|uniref:histidine kinase n=1 Tax=Stenomitos frigidus AS-A4 TaxID=2933935 RepID=A0ABV0KQK6_9CYAN|nr:ATP-binding protein [Phormidium sp. FACHB-592]MBD2075172.1 histidine kinase [Phormidium sp. FACHB-592]